MENNEEIKTIIKEYNDIIRQNNIEKQKLMDEIKELKDGFDKMRSEKESLQDKLDEYNKYQKYLS